MTLFPSGSNANLAGRTVDTPDGTLKFQRRLIPGTSGTVYIAEYTKTHRQVAVKVIPRVHQSADRSAEEFHVQQDVQGHENIAHTVAFYSSVRIGHHGIHSSFTGDLLVFDFYRGGDLFNAIASYHYGAQEGHIRDTFLQILSAVEYCHKHGVSHRDLKPENILCSEDGRHVFLADFGLATTEEMVHYRCGSPMYMSWECSTHRSGDPSTFSAKASDVWSLGMILLALVTGHCAWQSVQHPDYKSYRTNPDLFWKERFPISRDLRHLLNTVFVEKAEERITLQELRQSVVDMPTFYLNKGQLANAPPTVRAVWVAYVEKGRIQREERSAFKPSGSNSRLPSSAKSLLHHARKVLPFIRTHGTDRVQVH